MPHECTNCGRRFDDGSKQMLSGCPDCGGNKFQFRPAGRDSGDADASPGPDVSATSSDASTASDASPNPTDGSSTPAPDTPSVDDAATADGVDAADAVDGEDNAQHEARSSAATPDEIAGAGGRSSADAPDTDDEPTAGGEPATDGEPAAESTAGRTRGTPQGPPTEGPSGADADEFVLSGAVGPDDGEPVEKQPVAGSAPEAENATSGDDDADLTSLREELNDQFESIKITEPGRYELNLMELYDRQEYIISLQEDGRYVIEMAENYGVDDR